MGEYNTYARTVVSDQRKLVKVIAKYASPKAVIVNELDQDYKSLNVVTAKALKDALKHPHSKFIHFTINALADYGRAVRSIFEQMEMVSDEKLYIEEAVKEFQLSLEDMEGAEFDQLGDVVDQLEGQYIKLVELEEGLSDSLNNISSLISELTEMISNQDKRWDDYRDEYNKKLVDTFNDMDFPLTEIEQQELLSQDSWESMLEKVSEMKIELPKNLDVSHPNFGTYFKLKAYLAMYASLSRRMLPNSPEEIEKQWH